MIITPIGSVSPIRPELIPESYGETIGQVALEGFLQRMRYLDSHPAEKAAFERRMEAVAKKYGIQ